jgi:hypothetical protein
LVQSSNVEIQPLVNYSALFGVLGVQRVIFAILVDQVGEDGAAEKLKNAELVSRNNGIERYLQ